MGEMNISGRDVTLRITVSFQSALPAVFPVAVLPAPVALLLQEQERVLLELARVLQEPAFLPPLEQALVQLPARVPTFLPPAERESVLPEPELLRYPLKRYRQQQVSVPQTWVLPV